MESVNLNRPISLNDFLNGAETFSNDELKKILDKVSHLLVKRAAPNPKNEEEELLKQIREQLPLSFITRVNELTEKVENKTITEEELLEMNSYLDAKGEYETKKIKLVQQYSELKGIPFVEMFKKLNPFNRTDESFIHFQRN